MNIIADPLLKLAPPDRLHYATGELLGADDFRDEQTYHRRQLARMVLFLHGSGVLAGLRVESKHQPGRDETSHEVELIVQPGLALDHAGRLIEVPKPACLRLRRWFDYIAGQGPDSRGADVGDLRAAWRADGAIPVGGAVVADVFLAFHACDRGYTPTFASGPFDSLDASQPSRVRDAYELSLVLRSEADVDLPSAFDPWSAVGSGTPEERLAQAREASLNAWQTLALPPADHAGGWHENPVGVDPTAVLLARLRLPATRHPVEATRPPAPDWSAATWSLASANINNIVRHFLFPSAALHRLAALPV